MKTIKKNNQIKRVKDEDAMDMVKRGWSYIPKSEWKANRVKPVEKKKKGK